MVRYRVCQGRGLMDRLLTILEVIIMGVLVLCAGASLILLTIGYTWGF